MPKILKDFENDEIYLCKAGGGMVFDKDLVLIPPEDLREAAIEWVKELRDESGFRLINTEDTMLCGDERTGTHCCDEGAINWIKHFFSITEDELKPKVAIVKNQIQFGDEEPITLLTTVEELK